MLPGDFIVSEGHGHPLVSPEEKKKYRRRRRQTLGCYRTYAISYGRPGE
jgi:hypothetical protein